MSVILTFKFKSYCLLFKSKKFFIYKCFKCINNTFSSLTSMKKQEKLFMDIRIAGGSIAGTDHIKTGQPGFTNNHDSFSWEKNDDVLVSVIADGCGSSKHCEVGAKIASKILSKLIFDQINRLLQSGDNPQLKSNFWNRIKMSFISKLSVLAESMGDSISEIVNQYFLFTIIGIVIVRGKAYIFSCGDGVYIIDGEIKESGPFPANAPPYIMYNITGSALFDENPSLLDISIKEILEPKQYDNILLGSDGVLDLIKASDKTIPNTNNIVGDISQFWEEDKYVDNSSMITRKLSLFNRESIYNGRLLPGLLKDDTTLVVIKKKYSTKEEVNESFDT